MGGCKTKENCSSKEFIDYLRHKYLFIEGVFREDDPTYIVTFFMGGRKIFGADTEAKVRQSIEEYCDKCLRIFQEYVTEISPEAISRNEERLKVAKEVFK